MSTDESGHVVPDDDPLPTSTTAPQPRKRSWFRRHKILTALLALLAITIISGIAGGGDDDTPQQAAPVTQPADPATPTGPTEDRIPEVTTPTEAEVAAPAASSLLDKVRDELGDSNRNVQRVQSAGPRSGSVEVRWAINDNITGGLRKAGVRSDVFKILKAISEETSLAYEEAILTGTFSMQDEFGKAEETRVLNLRYSRATIERINFDNITVRNNVLDLAETGFVHPEFK